MSVLDYAVGRTCTWHGPLEQAGFTRALSGGTGCGAGAAARCCPFCGGLAEETNAALIFWPSVRQADRAKPEYEAMMRWSQGKCFPDFDTLQNAYRQAKEE